MRREVREIVMGVVAALAVVALLSLSVAAQQTPQTTKETIRGQGQVTTEQLSGTVLQAEGNTLVVKMSNGDIRTFNVPESRKFIIDGNERTVHDIRPGTKLQATVTTTVTPVTERTTTVGTGKVWFVSGNNVILTLPNGENRQYKVEESYRFNVNGQKATVHDLRKGMSVSAEKIVEEPRTELATNIAVTGQAPPPVKPQVSEVQAPPPVRQRPTPTTQAAAAPPPPPVATPPAAPQAERAAETPAKLPKTASPFPLAGLVGLIFTGASLVLRRLH
jgi:hypothetical protein